MGRRLNVDHLSEKECEKILQVIQKDFELRQKEKERLGQIEEKVEKEDTKTSILAEQKRFNENCCIRCCQTFGFIFNRKQLCRLCSFYICNSCRTYFSEFRGYACDLCLEQRDLKRQSCEWFYSSVSRRFKRFGSAKVVRSFYKRKSYSDSELDSGYDPSHYSSFPNISPGKYRPMVQGIFDNYNNNINNIDNSSDKELPLPSTESPLRDKPIARASSLETLLPTAKELKSKSLSQIERRRSKEHGDYKSRKSKDTRDIYKEAFESAKRAEEIKFKVKFDNLLDGLQASLEKSAGSSNKYGSISYGEVITTFRSQAKDQLKNLSQRLQLAYESFDIPQKEDEVYQKVRQNISSLIEDILGESLDLTSDEAVSDLSSLSDESGAEHNSFEDQIAQAVLSKILDNHRKETGISFPDVTDGRLANEKHDQNLLSNSLEEEEGEIDDNSSDLTKDFEDLKKFVRETTQRRAPSVRSFDEKVEIEDIITLSVDYERAEKKENFEIRYSSLERVQRAEPPLPDFSDLENIDFNTYEVDPDLLSMNLAIIPEETEEDLDKVSKNEEDKTQWRNNWIIQGSVSPYDNCGKRKIGGDEELFMMVPQPDDETVPRVGNEDADELSDFSDDEDFENEVTDEENSFYAKTSEELARISRKLSNSSFLTDSDPETKSRSSLDLDNFKRTIYRSDSETTDSSGPIVDKSKTKLKFAEELIPADNDDPKFILAPESVTIQEGEPLKLTCRVAGSADVDVFWYHEDDEVEELEDSEDYEISNEGDKHSITMYNLKKEHAGQYMCIALSEAGKCTQYFVITIKGNKQELKKPEFLKGLQDVEVHEGRSVKFRCKVKGYPQPRVTWHKDGKHFKNPLNARIEKFGNRDYILTIDYATMDDDAEYSVVATNIAGQAKSTAQVIVEPAKTDEEMKSQATTPSTPSALTPDSDSKQISHDIQAPMNMQYQNGINDLSDKFLATKYNMSYVAEEMLGTANEFTYLNHHLDQMNRQLDKIENNIPTSDLTFSNNINAKLGDTSLLEAVANHQAMENSAKSVRMLTSNALNILRTAEEIIQNEHDSDSNSDMITSTPRLSVTESRLNEKNDKHNGTEPFESMDELESVTSDMGASMCADDISFQSYQAGSTSVVEETNSNNVVNGQQSSELTLDYTVPDYDPSLNMADFSVQTQDMSQVPHLHLNFGPKEINKSQYERDFYVGDRNKEKKRWDVKLEHFSPTAEIVNRQNGSAQTEEQIYLAAGKVYSLGDRVKELEARVKNVDDDVFVQTPRMTQLEDEVAKTVAQVSQREREVNIIESAVNKLQVSTPVTSPRLSIGDNSSQLSSPRLSVDSGFSSVRDRPQPVHIVGTTAEEEVPESRGEFDTDSGVELPSVNRLKAMFSNQRRDEDLGNGNFQRHRDDTQVHSITARSLAKSKSARQNPEYPQGLSPHSASMVTLNLSSQQDINANEKLNQVKAIHKNLKKTVINEQKSSANSSARFVPNLSNPPTYTDLEPGHDPVLIYPEEETQGQSVSGNVKQMPQTFSASNVSSINPSTSSASISLLNNSDKKGNYKLDVKRAVPKIRSGCISARAAFWEKRIETGDAKKMDVEGDFPEMVEPAEN